jgi:hypothetical protein
MSYGSYSPGIFLEREKKKAGKSLLGVLTEI